MTLEMVVGLKAKLTAGPVEEFFTYYKICIVQMY